MIRIVIRSDAGAVEEIGTGHIIRALKLADALRTSPVFKNPEVIFATREHPPYVLGGMLVKKAGYKVVGNSDLEPNSKMELHAILHVKPNIVILDRLETDSDFVVALKKNGIFVITFDDLGLGQHYSDLAIHALLQKVEPSPNVYIGYDYLFSLSEEIITTEVKKDVLKVFVSFGGFDSRELTAFFINLIPNIKGPVRYDVIVSEIDVRNMKALVELSSTIENKAGVEIVVHRRPVNYYNLLCISDLAVVSGGLTAFGCAQAGIPTIGIPQYDHQLENLNRLEMRGCLKHGARGMELDSALLAGLVTDLSGDYAKRKEMGEVGVKIIDGKGLDRTINLIAHSYFDSMKV